MRFYKKMTRNISDKILKIIAYVITITFAVAIFTPMVFMLSNSLMDNKKVSDPSISFIPPISKKLSIVLDYSQETFEDDKLLECIKQDALITLYSTMKELDNESIFGIEVYAMKDGKILFRMEEHRMRLQSLLDYEFFHRAAVSRKLLLSEGNYIKLCDLIGYEFDENIKIDIKKFNPNDYDEIIETYLRDKYEVSGKYIGSRIQDKPFLMLQNYIYYYKLPTLLYKDNPIISNFSYFTFLFNTVGIVLFAIVVQVILCSTAGFALSRLFSRRVAKILLFYFLGVGMIPYITVLIPQFVFFKKLGLFDNYGALLGPWLIPNGFSVYLFMGFFDRIPKSLFEALKIDGGSKWYMYKSICMPLSKSITTIIALTTFIGGWNTFFWEWMVAQKQNLWTMNVAIYNLSKIDLIKDNFLMGIAFIMIIPVIIVTFIFSDKIKQSVASSGLKG